MALGMCTRNIAAVFVALLWHFANPDPGIFVMIVLVVPLALIVADGCSEKICEDACLELASSQ